VKRRRSKKTRPSRKRRSHAAWTRLLERATLSRSPGDLSKAREAFLALPQSEQRLLARELVAARRGELTRAYADVISVAAGFRVSKERAGRPEVRPEVCVSFVVKGKRRKSSVPAARRVPEALFAYWTIGQERVLCAVPTDVDDARRLRRIRALAQVEAVATGQSDNAPGAIACAVKRANGVYAISCRHVFGMALMPNPPAVDAPEIRIATETIAFAHATQYAGPLANHLQYSFDSQLAEVKDLERLQDALGDITYASRALGWDDLQVGVDSWILTPRGPVLAQYAKQHFDPVEYSNALNDIRHRVLARFVTPNGSAIEGDSGAPIMSAQRGGKLLGMLVAGDQETYALAIPAWDLLEPAHYALQDAPWDFWPDI
jgi:hypothetical protein